VARVTQGILQKNLAAGRREGGREGGKEDDLSSSSSSSFSSRSSTPSSLPPSLPPFRVLKHGPLELTNEDFGPFTEEGREEGEGGREEGVEGMLVLDWDYTLLGNGVVKAYR